MGFARKAESWDQAGLITAKELMDLRNVDASDLEVYKMEDIYDGDGIQPIDFFENKPPKNIFLLDHPIYNEILVDTQGANYARYIAKLCGDWLPIENEEEIPSGVDMRDKRVRVVKIMVSDGGEPLPFSHLDGFEKNKEFSEKYVGIIGIAKSANEDGSPSEIYLVTFSDGQIGNFDPDELELVSKE